MPPRPPLDLAGVLAAKMATVLDEPSSPRSLEKEFGVDMGRGLPRLGGHARMQHILHTHLDYPGVIIAAYGTEVREDLTTLPEEFGSWERHDEEFSSSPLWSSRKLACTGNLADGRIGGFECHHALLYQIFWMLQSAAKDSCSDCPIPTPDQTSTGCPPKLQQSSHGTGKRLRSRQRGSNTGNLSCSAVPVWHVPAVRQAIQVRQQGQGSKGAKATGGGANSDRVVIFMILAQLVLATVHGSSHDIRVGGPCSFHLFERNSVHEICQRRDRYSSFPSRIEAESDPDARQPTPLCAL